MKIVNSEAFMALPDGTVYSKYEPCAFEGLSIKGDTVNGNDFFYVTLTDALKTTGTENIFDVMEKVENGQSVDIDLNQESRDGCFEDTQLYAVWEKQDVQALIARLTQSLTAYPD